MSKKVIGLIALATILIVGGSIFYFTSTQTSQLKTSHEVNGLDALKQGNTLDQALNSLLVAHQVTPLTEDDFSPVDAAKVELGKLLYFDKILSGNKNISCATCHHPREKSGDGIALSLGTGANGLGEERVQLSAHFTPRNAPEVFNRGHKDWQSMFWDSRVALLPDGRLDTPAEQSMPQTVNNVLVAQAMFPVTSNDEMRGNLGDKDVDGNVNKMALIPGQAFQTMWASLMDRLMAIPEYVTLFEKAYPDIPPNQLGFEHAAEAIAHFEIEAFTFLDSPWNNYLMGNLDAISHEAKEGAILFFGEAGCGRCHNGDLLTDQQHYNLLVPQIGFGKKDADMPSIHLDYGRGHETEAENDYYLFRTPSLHNVSLNKPYMHNGAYNNLEDAIRHHLDPIAACRAYDAIENLPTALQETFKADQEIMNDMLTTFTGQSAPNRDLSEAEIALLITFLETLTDPAAGQDLDYMTPAEVPSGLPVEDELPVTSVLIE